MGQNNQRQSRVADLPNSAAKEKGSADRLNDIALEDKDDIASDRKSEDVDGEEVIGPKGQLARTQQDSSGVDSDGEGSDNYEDDQDEPEKENEQGEESINESQQRRRPSSIVYPEGGSKHHKHRSVCYQSVEQVKAQLEGKTEKKIRILQEAKRQLEHEPVAPHKPSTGLTNYIE